MHAASPARPAAGTVVYNGHCYDRSLHHCRIYAIADGDGGMEWRIVRQPFDGEGGEGGVERCFRSYTDAMKWIA